MGPAALTAGAGLLGGSKNNKGQQKAANSANAAAQSQIAMQTQLFQTIMNLANKNAPLLNADSQVANLGKDMSFWNGKQLQGTAAAMRTSGYNPGDSEINTRLDGITGKNQMAFAQAANQIRVNAPMQQAALYGMANPTTLNAGIGYNQNQAAMHYGMMSNPGSFLGALSPFLNGQSKNNGNQYTSGGASVGTGIATASTGGPTWGNWGWGSGQNKPTAGNWGWGS